MPPAKNAPSKQGRGGLSQVWRVLVVLVTTAGALMLLSALLAGFNVEDFRVALVTAGLLGLINALVWPLVIRFALPFTVLTLGLGVLALNVSIVSFETSVAVPFSLNAPPTPTNNDAPVNSSVNACALVSVTGEPLVGASDPDTAPFFNSKWPFAHTDPSTSNGM